MKRFIVNNALSLVLFGLFFLTLIGLMMNGYAHQNEELQAHGQQTQSFSSYLVSSEFYEAVFENWESEFLQMGMLVILTIWLKQQGSADSKKMRGKEPVDTRSRYSIIRASSWHTRRKAIGSFLYGNSLSFALFSLFLICFWLHAASGVDAANQEALLHGQSQQSVWQYIGSAQFWFESFQNWQSEFLSVAVLIVLSIFLRQRHSPESKPVSAPHKATGE